MLVLASYFPRPGNPLIGLWALAQAQALRRRGVELHVAALTPWIPRRLANLRHFTWQRARAAAGCPPVHRWGELEVHYPRWAYYNLERLARAFYRRPSAQLLVGWLSARRSMTRAMRSWTPDVLFAHQTRSAGFVAERLSRACDVPFVIAEHDFDDIDDCFSMAARRHLYERVLGRAACVVVPSDRMESAVERLVPGTPVQVLRHGADPLPDELVELRHRRERSGDLVIFSAGFFYPRKAFPALVRAFTLVASRHPRAVLRIAGEGSERGAIERAIEASTFRDRIHLVGALSHDAVLEEMARADVFALIGRDEPWGVVFTEAMAAGCPIVWGTGGGIADVLVDGVHGFGVPPADAAATAARLDVLLADEAMRMRMSAAVRRLHAAELTWDANAETLTAILRRAVS